MSAAIREVLHETDTRRVVYETSKSYRAGFLDSDVTVYEREPGSSGWQAIYSLRPGVPDSIAFRAFTPAARATAKAIGTAHATHRAAALDAARARMGGTLNGVDTCPTCSRPAHPSESTDTGEHPACYTARTGEPTIDGEGDVLAGYCARVAAVLPDDGREPADPAHDVEVSP